MQTVKWIEMVQLGPATTAERPSAFDAEEVRGPFGLHKFVNTVIDSLTPFSTKPKYLCQMQIR